MDDINIQIQEQDLSSRIQEDEIPQDLNDDPMEIMGRKSSIDEPFISDEQIIRDQGIVPYQNFSNNMSDDEQNNGQIRNRMSDHHTPMPSLN